jgi:hypothetical protein
LKGISAKRPWSGLILKLIASSAVKSWSVMDGGVNLAGTWRIFKSITFGREADWAMT